MINAQVHKWTYAIEQHNDRGGRQQFWLPTDRHIVDHLPMLMCPTSCRGITESNTKEKKAEHTLPCNMGRRAKELDLGAEHEEHQMTEVLDRKRRQIDQEIAEFKAEKEHEYRVFERQFGGKCKENGVQDALQSQHKRGRSKQKNAAAESGLMQKEEANYVQRESDDRKTCQKGPGSEAEDLKTTFRSNSSPGGSPTSPDRPTQVLHERETEFQGLFTPSYLPLVGDAPADEENRCKGLLQPPPFDSGHLSAARHNGSAMFSSSAETVHPPMTSPPLLPARPLSSSVPPEKPSHHRSDSSRSDSSIASLRSSLRDPRQPRSPKRVLFSIDDTLVSPSTSPIAQRSKSAMPTEPADPVDAISGFEKLKVMRNHNGNDLAFTRLPSNDVGLSSLSAPANGSVASSSMFGRAAESNISKPSPSAGGVDDFEYRESDDLFTFDEEMGWAGNKNHHETDPEDEYDEDVKVDDKKSDDPPTAGSPHAGSLPIEIKWPGRRESRG